MTTGEARDRAPLSVASWPAQGLEAVNSCPVCGCRDRRLAYRHLEDRVMFCAPGDWTLYTCSRCQSSYLDPRPTLDTIALAYSTYFTHEVSERPAVETMSAPRRWQRALANGYRNWRYGTRERPASPLGVPVTFLSPHRRALLDSEFRHLPRTNRRGRVLDIGFGDGLFLRWAEAAGWETFGIDPDPVAVANAERRGLNVECGTTELLAGREGQFEVVTLSHVIEHAHQPRELLEQIHRVLVPGGRLWLDTPNLESVGHRVFGRDWIGLDPPRHLVLFTPSTLRATLRDVGFRRIKVIPRFEVSKRVFAASARIAAGSRRPLGDEPPAWPVALRAEWAAWLVRFNPRQSEFITIIATT